MSKIYALFSLFIVLCCLNSCKPPYDNVDLNVKLNPEYAIPLLETEMGLRDLFDNFNGDAFLKVQSDGTFQMLYQGKMLETQPFNLFAGLPDVQTIPIIQADIGVPFPSPSNTRIDAIDFKNGFLKWRFDAQAMPLNVRISVPQFTKNGQPFLKEFILTNEAYRDSINLNSWHCEPTQGNIVFSCQATKANGESVSLNNQGTYELTRFEATSIEGYFGQFLVALPKNAVALDFFQMWRKNGKILFTEPKITFNFENSYGFPIQARTSTAESINQAGQKIALESPLTTGVNLPYPTLNEMGAVKNYTQSIDSKNSNLGELLASNLTEFSQSVIAITNLGNTSKMAGFYTEKCRLKVSYTLEVPIVGTAENFVVFDTLPIVLSNFSQVSAAEFKLTTDNSLPLDMNLQAYFINDTGGVIDSLVQKQPLILRGAPTTAFGTTIGSNLAYNFIKMDAAKFNNIRPTKRIIVKYTVSSTNNGANAVRINSAQLVGLKLGVRVGVNL
jgi:hypothetical protein